MNPSLIDMSCQVSVPVAQVTDQVMFSLHRSAADTSSLLVLSTKSMKDNPTILLRSRWVDRKATKSAPKGVIVYRYANGRKVSHTVTPKDLSSVVEHIVPPHQPDIVSDNLVAALNASTDAQKLSLLHPAELVSDKIPVTESTVFSDRNIPVGVHVLPSPSSHCYSEGSAFYC